jgi:hypothetical protein
MRLEGQLQGQLKRPRSTFLEEWVQPTETLIQHSGRTQIEGPKLDKTKRIGEVRMVQSIECIRSELKVQPAGNGELSSN